MNVVIVSAVRTPIGRFQGSLTEFSAQQLGAIVIKEAVKRAKINSEEIDEVIMGNVISAGLGQNPARQSMIFANLNEKIPAFTINKVCGSGLKAVMLATQSIKANDNKIVVAGGMESMTNAPYVSTQVRHGLKMWDAKLIDAMVYDGLWDVYNNFHMGITGEIIAKRHNLKREEIDEFAFESHFKSAKATKEGKFREEIIPIEIKKKNSPFIFDKDEGIREDTTIEKLAKLKPAFKEDGVLTAGNSSQISDGASALVIMAEDKADELGIKPLVKVHSYLSYGVKPELVMEAPIPTVRQLLEKVKLKIEDIDLFEHNEAFASASLSVRNALNIPKDKFNVNGGAVALGHPIGCSGARILTTLIYELKRRNVKRGLATLCLGGGNAVAMIVENYF